MLKGLFILAPQHVHTIYGEPEQRDIRRLVDIYAPPQTPESIRENPALLHDADVIFSGWGAPTLDTWFLEHAPNLKAFFYGAGSIRGVVTDAFWQRDIPITSVCPISRRCPVHASLSWAR